MVKNIFIMILAWAAVQAACAQDTISKKEENVPIPATVIAKSERELKWYDKLKISGYAQVRYNRLFETNENLRCDQCDKSIGSRGSIFLRRARITLSGNPHEKIFIYIQSDVAVNAMNSATLLTAHYLQLREMYGEISLNKKNTLKIRTGVCKVPFGFDNLQSSQKRIAFDRSDAINSAMYNERDLGVFLYWTPPNVKEKFKQIVLNGLRGTGDYGLICGGIFNGQTLNRLEQNDNVHAALRVTYPFEFKGGKFLEASIQGFTGYYNTAEVKSSSVTSEKDILDQRVAASIVLFPQPFGIQMEYTYGNGPEFTKSNGKYFIQNHNLQGGYVMTMYRLLYKSHVIIPYYRYQYYDGGKKVETDSRSHRVKEHEMGIEWCPINALELNVAYMISDRRYEDSKLPVNTQKGSLLRLQLQFNY